MSKPFLFVDKDITKGFNDSIEALKNKSVLVGIPEDNSTREPDENGQVPFNNAAILAINEFGSSDGHIPSRPVVRIGIWDSKERVAEQFKQAAKDVLANGQGAFEKYLTRAGFIASSQIKKTINEQIDIEPPSKGTLQARKYLNNGNGFKGTKALVVTGQMRNAITFVVRSIKLWGA